MIKKHTLLFFIFFVLSGHVASAQVRNATPQDSTKMQWFGDAKLGIFIHWGIYAVNGIPESWSFFNNYISHTDYMKQLDGFTAAKYKPEEWARLIKASGARYAVITTKHHDGVALWDSRMGGINTKSHTPARQDVLTPFVKALRKENLKTGLYFSLPDWSYPDYDVASRTKKRYTLAQEPRRWEKFRTYYQGQLRELSERYNPDLYWFDGDWEHSAEEWESGQVRDMLVGYNKNVIINSRLSHYGDYATPEQGVPVIRPQDPYWELCLTMNDSWGYSPHDRHYKSPNQIIRTLADCIGNGGNLLLDIGPKPDGTIPEEQAAILKELGRWTKKHEEAIFGTVAGIPEGHFYGNTTLSKDRRTLYLFVTSQGTESVRVRGLASPVKGIKVVGNHTALPHEKQGNAIFINVPAREYDPEVTVLALTFDEPLRLTSPEPAKLTLTALQKAGRSDAEQDSRRLRLLADNVQAGHNPFQQTALQADGEGVAQLKLKDAETARWVQQHAEALYHTQPGLPAGHYNGATALSEDRQTLFLFVEGKPSGPIAIKGLKNKVQRIRVVGNGTLLPHQIFNKQYWSDIPGIAYIDVPADLLDPHLTVLALLLDGPAELYREDIKPIESN
ncbi:alpha-L-fucosidase [Pontibacter sp. E15-1]|uniref:alpha-L-fucosidase n=1 Tax=Pontibacter sp. E15-1 TaxID=2919918 RepID=UPI001F4F111B|nr:alpha-L-fucosidase [Pontibacter sp. E15-1]MCJ8164093.1 alpha-L-fucosidase [Pontibacter sp. E15-1]